MIKIYRSLPSEEDIFELIIGDKPLLVTDECIHDLYKLIDAKSIQNVQSTPNVFISDTGTVDFWAKLKYNVEIYRIHAYAFEEYLGDVPNFFNHLRLFKPNRLYKWILSISKYEELISHNDDI